MFSQTVSQYPLQNPSQPAAEQDPLHEIINPQLDIHELFPSKPEHASKLHDLLHPLPQLPEIVHFRHLNDSNVKFPSI